MSYLNTLMEHAVFSPSQPAWLNYEDDQFIFAFRNAHRAELGTEIHEWCSVQIKLNNRVSNIKEIEKGIKTHIFEKYKAPATIDYQKILLRNVDYLPKEIYPTVKLFVNDSIGYGMESERKVVYSDLFWGTSDAILLDKDLLRVFDLKTGSKPAKETQLYVYAALYCLENHLKPGDLIFETRIYQNAEVLIDNPPTDVIYDIMHKIVHADSLINKHKGGRL